MLWQVVLADGVIDDHESALMRRLAGLIHVEDADSARRASVPWRHKAEFQSQSALWLNARSRL